MDYYLQANENLFDSAYQVAEGSDNFLVQYVALHFPQNIKREILAEPARVPLVSDFEENPEEACCGRSRASSQLELQASSSKTGNGCTATCAAKR